MECEFGCIFDGDKLYGDCRMPESKECAMERKRITKDDTARLEWWLKQSGCTRAFLDKLRNK